MNELRPNEQRSKTAITLIWLILAIEGLSIASGVFQLIIYTMIDQGEFVSENLSLAGSFTEGAVGLLYLSMYIVSAITFIRWFRRAYYNLETLTHNIAYGEGWAAGAWFVPVMNLFVPYRIMNELYTKTDKYLKQQADRPYPQLKTTYLPIWWALWIIAGIAGNIIFRTSLQDETIAEMIDSQIMSIIGSLIGVPLAIVTIIVINDYAKAEKVLYEIVQEGVEDRVNELEN
ncbi:DUF4328 domain-containing protein [Dysgonomonas sp. BGC7]|uniref:DUF4328 domain-containing protein n=1 Tax=Dysgonomonas sp. BGC7 TaxID=1658008 RepID=UPI000682E0E8|nr:DUF4328 domain-containing protein [Dysgonomonas sp. BGC7]MBD8389482.1 DUF4328 domain-containing protein [Dysgonomonas sp. BGC7]